MQGKFELPEIPDIDAIMRMPAPPRHSPKPAPAKASKPAKAKAELPPIDPEQESKEELGKLQTGFVARAKAEAARQTLSTDSEYWICLCFQTREQVEAFLRESGWAEPSEKYIDGRKVAREMEITLPADPQYPKVRKIDKSWSGLVDSR